MRVIVAGSREIVDFSIIESAIIKSGFAITEIISGTARGVDKLGELYGEKNNIRVTRFPADWNRYGKSAGYIRNEEMAKNADALIAIWDGKSRGTKNMIDIATKKELKVFVLMMRDH